MEAIYKKLTEITNIWNDFILEQKYFRNILKFNEETDTNYCGDIIHYLKDTFSIVENHETKKETQGNFHDYIFYVIGFLQTLYVQQDLVDELRVIFELPSSNSENRKEIRCLRNELVGHPISRDRRNKLISTVFWGDKLSFNNINYIRYTEGEFGNSENISINVDSLIDSHKKYLSDSFDEILKKEKKMIKRYSKELSHLINMIKADNRDLEKIIEVSKIYVSGLIDYSYIFSHEYARQANSKQTLDNRYSYYLEYYYSVIEEIFYELISSCDEYLISKIYEIGNDNVEIDGIIDEIIDDEEKVVINVIHASNISNSEMIDNPQKTYRYYFQKLGERKQPYFIDLLINENDDFEVIEELNRMKYAFYDEDQFEYYCSFIYVKKLLDIPH